MTAPAWRAEADQPLERTMFGYLRPGQRIALHNELGMDAYGLVVSREGQSHQTTVWVETPDGDTVKFVREPGAPADRVVEA